ncbi:hypothetical protein EYF80_011538 [Liparis tanakae]|uniref:Uncharacterized protein n=1 Tax=Liparis tanakae TaxID=230148 RepID=A0A4Z2IKM0_9TELE|nr:hypothetical protein EYF80_011538 [Liparis tanakae]
MGTSPTASLPPHQLPDQRQGVQPAALVQVLSPDADQREVSHVPAQLHRVVAVLQLRRKRKIPLATKAKLSLLFPDVTSLGDTNCLQSSRAACRSIISALWSRFRSFT